MPLPNLSLGGLAGGLVSQVGGSLSQLSSGLLGSLTGGLSFAFQIPMNAYILDLKGGGGYSYLPFQFMPADIRDSKTAVYQDYPIIGRSIPLKAYSYSQARTISLTLQFFTMPIEKLPYPDPYTIKTWIDKLRSYTYPDYTNGIDPPHTVMLRIGFSIAMQAVITSYNRTPSIGWFGPGPLLPHGESIALTFAEVRDIPLSYDEVAGGSDFFPGSSGALGDALGMGGSSGGAFEDTASGFTSSII